VLGSRLSVVKDVVVTFQNWSVAAVVSRYTSYDVTGHSLLEGVHVSVGLSAMPVALFAGPVKYAHVGIDPVLKRQTGHPDAFPNAFKGTIFQ
jgi:hypothetical protein